MPSGTTIDKMHSGHVFVFCLCYFPQLEKALNVSVSFLIVRHPFERLLSAYRDKIMFAIPHSLHDKLGNKIIRKYRKNVS